MNPTDLPSRLAERIAVSADGCWNWGGYVKPDGYGMARWGGRRDNGSFRTGYVHRITYSELRDPSLPVFGGRTGMQIDHLCLNKRCCNPDHLEVVTPAENGRRASTMTPTPSPQVDLVSAIVAARGVVTSAQIADEVAAILPRPKVHAVVCRMVRDGRLVVVGRAGPRARWYRLPTIEMECAA